MSLLSNLRWRNNYEGSEKFMSSRNSNLAFFEIKKPKVAINSKQVKLFQ